MKKTIFLISMVFIALLGFGIVNAVSYPNWVKPVYSYSGSICGMPEEVRERYTLTKDVNCK